MNTRYHAVAARLSRLEECKKARGVLQRRLAYITEHEPLADDVRRSGLTAMKRRAQAELAALEGEMAAIRAELKKERIEA